MRSPVVGLSLLSLCGLWTSPLVEAFTGSLPSRVVGRARATAVRQRAASLSAEPSVLPKHLANKASLPPLDPEDEWIGKLDLNGFGKEIRYVSFWDHLSSAAIMPRMLARLTIHQLLQHDFCVDRPSSVQGTGKEIGPDAK